MKLCQLSYFIKMIELGNIKSAGNEFNAAQSALSQQLSNLKGSLDMRLFDRTVPGN